MLSNACPWPKEDEIQSILCCWGLSDFLEVEEMNEAAKVILNWNLTQSFSL